MDNHQEFEKLVKICQSNLKNSKDCINYLVKERGLDKKTILENKIGFFPQNISILKNYISEEFMAKMNITNFSGGSDFSDYFYLVFPIFSEYGDLLGISGRTLLEDGDRRLVGIPKYKNTSYKKADVLYGLNKSKKHILEKNNVFVTEGYFDHISMSRNNLKNSVAICGTAFSKKHFVKLARYTDKITFILDADDAGQKSAERIYNKFINKGIKLRFLKLPNGVKDVDEYFSADKTSRGTFFKDFKQIIPETW
jgi:DNA primase